MPKRGTLGVFVLAMLNLAVICTLRGLPMLAKEGLSLIFYYTAAAVIFLVPVSLITAELATGWPPRGVYMGQGSFRGTMRVPCHMASMDTERHMVPYGSFLSGRQSCLHL